MEEEKIKIPSLLRDLIQEPELEQLLGHCLIRVLQALIGSPLSLNLRNLAWHGFITPGELSAGYATSFLHIISTIGSILEANKVVVKERRVYNLQQIDTIHAQICTYQEGEFKLDEGNGETSVIPSTLRSIWQRMLRLYTDRRYLSCLVLGLPLLETTLRAIFVQLNV